MQKAGAYLKSVREDKGYTIQEISKATKLSSPVIRALEEGRIDNVDPVYLKGFLKLYCRYLGLSWEAFISEHHIPALAKGWQKSSPVKPSASPAGRQIKNKKAAVVNGLKPFTTNQGFSFSKLVSANKKIIAAVLAIIAVLLFTFIIFRGCIFLFKKLPVVNGFKPFTTSFFKFPKAKIEKPKAPVPAKVIKAAPAKKSVSLVPAKVSVPVANSSGNMKPNSALVAKEPVKVGSPLVGAQNSKPKEITLTIRAQEDSFITLKVDGKIVYQRMMYKGKAETWSAKTKIELSVGNAGGLSLEVNGKPLLPLGKKGQQIKNILINSEGLKVLQ